MNDPQLAGVNAALQLRKLEGEIRKLDHEHSTRHFRTVVSLGTFFLMVGTAAFSFAFRSAEIEQAELESAQLRLENAELARDLADLEAEISGLQLEKLQRRSEAEQWALEEERKRRARISTSGSSQAPAAPARHGASLVAEFTLDEHPDLAPYLARLTAAFDSLRAIFDSGLASSIEGMQVVEGVLSAGRMSHPVISIASDSDHYPSAELEPALWAFLSTVDMSCSIEAEVESGERNLALGPEPCRLVDLKFTPDERRVSLAFSSNLVPDPTAETEEIGLGEASLVLASARWPGGPPDVALRIDGRTRNISSHRFRIEPSTGSWSVPLRELFDGP